MAVLEDSCQGAINFHKLITMILILITAVYVCSFWYFVYRLDDENAYFEVMEVLTLA